MPEYKVIRSARRTLALQLTPEGLIVRAPQRTSEKEIERFVASHADWIKKNAAKLETAKTELANIPKLTPEELRALAQRAVQYIPARVEYYAQLMGVSYGRITIRSQKTKWGSCTAQGNLNFNCMLMLTPPEVIDCIVVHELAHRKEMNHSARFYAEVQKAFPAYNEWNGWLKEHGTALLQKLPKE